VDEVVVLETIELVKLVKLLGVDELDEDEELKAEEDGDVLETSELESDET